MGTDKYSGSSPRVRGTHNPITIFYPFYRFIPACAGNTCGPMDGICSFSVHPRVCGEHRISPADIFSIYGSSPRVRGTRYYAHLTFIRSRFIPACAGNTVLKAMPAAVGPVHPRVCGEHLSDVVPSLLSSGSSPRVRGTPIAVLLILDIWWFIPACAGNT